MKQKNLTLQNFSHGVVSNYGDFSTSSYYHSAKKLLNMLITPYGFLTRRPPALRHRKITNLDALKIITFNDNNNVITIECFVGYFIMYINDSAYNFGYQIVNNYTQEDILQLTYVEDPENISLYLFTPKKPPLIFKYRQRYDLPNYSVMTYEMMFVDGPYEPVNTNSTITMAVEATSGYNKNLSCSFGLFTSSDVGRYVAILYNGVWGCGKIRTYVDSKNVKIDIYTSFLALTANSNFKFSAWGAKNGYPSFGVIFEGRLCVASSPKFPKSIWISKYENYTLFSATTRMPTNPITESILDTDSITINLASNQSVLWLKAYKNALLIGTNAGVSAIRSAVLGEWISPLNYGIFDISDDSTSMALANKNGFVFYVDIYKKTIYVLFIMQDKIISIKNITAKSQHLFTSAIKDIKFIEYPFKMLWVLLNNGELLGCSIIAYEGSYNYAWHSHKLGGEGLIEQISTGYNDTKSVLMCVVNRNINNVVEKTMEAIEFSDFYSLLNEPVFCVYLDGQFITKMVANNNPRMGEHIGKTLAVLLKNDMVYLENFPVVAINQSIEGNYPNQDVYWGYPYESKFVSNDLDDPEFFGEYKTINKIYLKTINTNEVKYATTQNNTKSHTKTMLDNINNSQVNIYQLDIQQDFSRVKNLSIWQNNYTHLNISYVKINLIAV